MEYSLLSSSVQFVALNEADDGPHLKLLINFDYLKIDVMRNTSITSIATHHSN